MERQKNKQKDRKKTIKGKTDKKRLICRHTKRDRQTNMNHPYRQRNIHRDRQINRKIDRHKHPDRQRNICTQRQTDK